MDCFFDEMELGDAAGAPGGRSDSTGDGAEDSVVVGDSLVAPGGRSESAFEEADGCDGGASLAREGDGDVPGGNRLSAGGVGGDGLAGEPGWGAAPGGSISSAAALIGACGALSCCAVGSLGSTSGGDKSLEALEVCGGVGATGVVGGLTSGGAERLSGEGGAIPGGSKLSAGGLGGVGGGAVDGAESLAPGTTMCP